MNIRKTSYEDLDWNYVFNDYYWFKPAVDEMIKEWTIKESEKERIFNEIDRGIKHIRISVQWSILNVFLDIK